ncbi:MAG: hypothetical protein GY812_17315 [Actinomycetia bacterium]|nr:hypothetical protein [Actinomycetes bacterium]
MPVLVALAAVAALGASACIPQNRDNFGEASGEAALAGPPVFPETGEVPPELLIEGLVYDFTNADVDLDLWVPPTSEARCAAEKIVANHGKRLSDVGYEPGRTGAGLNDVALTPEERSSVSSLFMSCINSTEMLASLFMGGGHMTPDEALCMARGLDEMGMAPQVIDNLMLGSATDPLDEEGALAQSLLEYTDVCLPDTAFTWFGFDLPGDQEVQGLEGESDSGQDLPGEAGNITTTTVGRPTGGEGG